MNNECGSFWFWFMRPFAEMLGGLTIFAIIAAIYIGFIFYFNRKSRKEKK